MCVGVFLGLLTPVAHADHPGAGGRDAPYGPLAMALMWAGLAALVVLIVFAVIAILTRRPQGEREDDLDT